MERVENPGHIRQVRTQRGGVPTRRLLRRRADQLSDRQRARIAAALDAGDPHNEVTAAWLIAQQLMAAYANPDRAAGPAVAERVITAARNARSRKSAGSGGLSPRGARNTSPGSTNPRCPTVRPRTSTSRSRTPNGPPGATDRSAITDCDYFSTMD